MKKVILLLLALLLTVAAIPYRGPYPQYAIGESISQPSYSERISRYTDVLEQAPIIAEVEIIQHKGDLPDDIYYYGSLYLARVTSCYKNTSGKELSLIELVQDGNSQMTYAGYPLFQTGDRLLLPLISCEKDSVLSDTHPSYYRIYGQNQTAMQIVSSKAGDICFTFLPSLTDLPKGGVTAEMTADMKAVIEQKYNVPEGKIRPLPPLYNSVSLDEMKTWIIKELNE